MKRFEKAGLIAAFLLCVVGVSRAQTAGTVNLTASPTTACAEKCTPTLTWSTTPAAQSCSAPWTTKTTASGTQVVTEITATTVYTLSCSWAGVPDPVTVSWVAPTQNTDGSTLLNLAGSKVLFGTSATALNTTLAVPVATATSAAVSGLTAGTWFFTARAVNAAGAESDNGNVVSRVVTVPTASASGSATVTVNPKPKPPSNIQVTVALAINVPLDSLDGFKRTLAMSITASGPGVPVGVVKLGTPSVGAPVFTWRNQAYCRFLLAHPVTGASNIAWIKGVSTTTDAAAPCA